MNTDKFRSTKLVRPVKEFNSPQLAGILFDEGEDTIIYIRGLTANEMLVARESRENNSVRNALTRAIGSGIESEMAEAFKRLIGNGVENKTTAAETAFRVEVLVGGITDAQGKARTFSHDLAVKLADNFPNLFLEITTAILALTGEGAVSGE